MWLHWTEVGLRKVLIAAIACLTGVPAISSVMANSLSAPAKLAEPDLYAGVYIRGFEVSAFKLDGQRDQIYWASGQALDAARGVLMHSSKTGYGEIFLIVCG